MRKQILAAIFLGVLCGCHEPPAERFTNVQAPGPKRATLADYKTLTESPDFILNSTWSEYPIDVDKFQKAWIEDTSKVPLDGQRTIDLLEAACYADVMCDPVEYHLRTATLNYIKQNMQSADVTNAVKWVADSYESSLPLDDSNEESRHDSDALVRAMNLRMAEYATLLKTSADSSKSRRLP